MNICRWFEDVDIWNVYGDDGEYHGYVVKLTDGVGAQYIAKKDGEVAGDDLWVIKSCSTLDRAAQSLFPPAQTKEPE